MVVPPECRTNRLGAAQLLAAGDVQVQGVISMATYAITADDRTRRLRAAWQLDVTVLASISAGSIIEYAERNAHATQEFRAGELIRTFAV
jgi:hypothetical protein